MTINCHLNINDDKSRTILLAYTS